MTEAVESRRTKHKYRGKRQVLGTFEYRSCLLKTRYPTQPALPSMAFRAYACDFCGGWHLTRKK